MTKKIKTSLVIDSGTTGTRTVKPQGMATIMKVTAIRRYE